MLYVTMNLTERYVVCRGRLLTSTDSYLIRSRSFQTFAKLIVLDNINKTPTIPMKYFFWSFVHLIKMCHSVGLSIDIWMVYDKGL